MKFKLFRPAKEAYKKHLDQQAQQGPKTQQAQQAQQATNRFFITLPIDGNERVNERVKVCTELEGSLDHSPHLTLYSGLGNISDIDTTMLYENKNVLKEIFLALSNTYNKQVGKLTTGYYKFLGRKLPQTMKDQIFRDQSFNP